MLTSPWSVSCSRWSIPITPSLFLSLIVSFFVGRRFPSRPVFAPSAVFFSRLWTRIKIFFFFFRFQADRFVHGSTTLQMQGALLLLLLLLLRRRRRKIANYVPLTQCPFPNTVDAFVCVQTKNCSRRAFETCRRARPIPSRPVPPPVPFADHGH